MSQFYALMPDCMVKRINLDEAIVTSIQNIFVSAGKSLKPEGVEELKFDGDVVGRDKESITYVEFDLPETFNRIPDNQADISVFEIPEIANIPKSIFYYHDDIFYFQVFNKKSMLQRKFILAWEAGNKFHKLNDVAFIIDDKIHAMYERKTKKFYFQNYQIANQIFPLKEFSIEASREEIIDFTKKAEITADEKILQQKANSKTRRLIKSLSSSDNIKSFMSRRPTTRQNLMKEYNLSIEIENDKIILPMNDVAKLNRVLEFLNEDIFKGAITNTLYRSNSKTPDKI